MRWSVVWLVVASCGHAAPPDTLETRGAVAVCGSVRIDADLVAAVAKQTDRSPRDALDGLVFDAAFAQGATARGLDRGPVTQQALRTARARIVMDRLEHEAEAKGPPTDAELAAATERHWREVDLPEQARVVHVVVVEKDPKKLPLAREVAEALHAAVVGATSEDDFLARARAVDGRGETVKPESLPTFVADGRLVQGNGSMDETFARAAFVLAPGETSGIVQSQFGFHVIRMLERLPPKQVPLEERRTAFAHEIIAERGHAAYVALLAELKRVHPVSVEPAASAILESAAPK